MNTESDHHTRRSSPARPPVLATRLLIAFLKPALLEEVMGDLAERFREDLKRRSRTGARIAYWIQVLHYLRPFAVRGFIEIEIKSNGMLHNYWKITWRVMARQKMYSAINIGGFAIGIAACLLITLYILHERSYDKHYTNTHNIYRVYRESTRMGAFSSNVWLPAPLADALLQFPEIEQAGHYVSASGLVDGRSEMKRADRPENFFEENIVYANQGLADILEWKFLSGNTSSGLIDPHTMLITRSKARKYFPDEDPLGKSMVLNNDDKNPFRITGVIEDHPVNTHFHPDFILSLKGHEFWPGEQNSWRASNYFNYVRVRSGTNSLILENKLHALVDKYFLPDAIANGNDASVDWAKSLRFKLQPVYDVHFNRAAVGDGAAHSDIRYVWLFAIIAFFIIVIASINFVNLSTARSANRAKEIGLRKAVGSARWSLIKQFLTESVVYCFVSVILACALAWGLLPFFSNIVGTPLAFDVSQWLVLPVLLGIALVIGVLAGLYPAFYLSSFRAAQVLRGAVHRGAPHSTLRSVLVVCQYTISVALIIGTLIIRQQMSYMMTKPLGFDKDQVFVLQSTHVLGEKIAPFRHELQNIAGVDHISVSGFLPVEGTRRNGSGMWKDVKGRTIDGTDTQQWTVDRDYLQTLGLKLLHGRNFSPDLASDSQAVIVNQRLLKAMDIKEPIGQVIVNPWRAYTIVGVVEDFHFESMRRDIAPLMLTHGKNEGAVSLKLNTTDVPAVVARVSSLWKEYAPDQPLRYTFLDQTYALMYADVERVGTILSGFTVLAIVIASLGLFALSAFTVEQRTKEISIRIVLGATAAQIVRLLTGNFIGLVALSFAIAAPIAWYLMHNWLSDFAYRISFGGDVFIIAAIAALLIALATVSVQAARAAFTSPAKNLRSE